MHTEIFPAHHPNSLSHAHDVLRHGGLVAFPTDTVYGLGTLVFSSQGIDRLYIAKGRNNSKSIAVLLSQIEDIDIVAQRLPSHARKLAEQFWPGPLTIIVERSSNLPDNLSPLSTVGIRIPDHPVALQLLKQTGPLAVTSANLSGNTNATTPKEVLEQLDGRIHLILDGGKTPGGEPSTVVDCTGLDLQILRAGPYDLKELQSVL